MTVLSCATGQQMFPDSEAGELMRSAWATRRSYLTAPRNEQPELMAMAREALVKAAELCRECGEDVELAQALHLRANVERDRGLDGAALSLWQEAIGILRETDDYLQLAHKVRHLGDLHTHCRRLREAESCYEEAVALYRTHAGPTVVDFANALRPMAILKERLGKQDEAIILWRQARGLYDSASLEVGVDECSRQIHRLESRDET